MKLTFFAVISILALAVAGVASASTASQREYQRGNADCSAGRYDQDQHGASYKKGCRAAEDKKDDVAEARRPRRAPRFPQRPSP